MFDMENEGPVYTHPSMDERAEIELVAGFKQVVALAGREAFRDAIMPFLLQHEADMRENEPNNPALAVIEEWREEQLRKERGFA